VRVDSFFLKSIPRTLKVLLGSRIPLRVAQFITYRCNLDCLYCARHASDARELETNQIKSLMSCFRKAGTLFWGFNGGEALVRDDIGELINYGKSLGMFVNVSTNGTLLARKCSEIRNADMVNVSLEGPKAVHDHMRSGSFDRMCEGIEAMRLEGIKFTFITCINSRNLDSLGFVLEFAEKHKTKAVFQPIRVQKEDIKAKSRDFFPARDRMREGIDYLLQEKRRGRPVGSSADYLRQVRISWPDGCPEMRCWAGRLYCSIAPEGTVTSCCDTLGEARKCEIWQPPEKVVEDFFRLPTFRCATCFAAMPLEANLAVSAGLKNPLSAARRVAAFFPRDFWRSQW
jgi:MoaA/NifB/PqqE/SkfB family radical SAM enzyme